MSNGFYLDVDGKYKDIDTHEELEVKGWIHPTYGEILYVDFEQTLICETCNGTGLVDEEECPTCSGSGEITTTEEIVETSYSSEEIIGRAVPLGWKASGGEAL